MSNHSADVPSGYLDGYNFKSFFGVAGTPGNFQWLKGQERVPENWVSNRYKSSSTQLTFSSTADPRTLHTKLRMSSVMLRSDILQ